ncbi:MAG: glycoside hydrolase family 88 protein [Clostridia bacterium]|nr:glycoside hydrolase family 88 protein [Clostridia bacterium]
MNQMDRVKRAALAMQRYSWEQGVLAQAFLECGEEEMALLLALEGANRQTADGRCAQIGFQDAATDPCAVGEALIFAAEKTGDPFVLKAKDALLQWALQDAPRNEKGIVYHLCSAWEFWVDSMYMLPPFLARAGYFDAALHQIQGYWDALWVEETGLLAHRYDEEKGSFIRKAPWGVGNGWACAGMARVMGLLPAGYEKEKAALAEKIGLLMDHALPLQMENGMFHDVLTDPGTFPELNAGQMFAYTIYRGVREGWLEQRYLPYAERVHERAVQCVDAYGLVRPVCGMPEFDRPGIAAEGQAFFILMESARQALFTDGE